MTITKPQRFVAEITLVVDGIGTQQTFYFSTSGFSTRPTDAPANAYVSPRLKSAGSLRRELFSGTRVTGAVRPSFGELVLFNGDGGLDAWMGYGISGGKVVVRIGDEDAAYPAGYTTVYVAYAQHIVADFSEVRVRIRDRLNLLEQPLVKESFSGAGGLEGGSALVGKLKQWISSDPYLTPVILVDSSWQLYFVQATGSGGLQSSFKIYEGGIEITRGADYASAADCVATSPSAGQCRFWFGVGGAGPVYVRLGSVPQLDLRAISFGYQPSGSAWQVRALAELGGISGGSGTLAVGAVLVDDGRTILKVMEGACASQFGYFGMTRLDAFVAGVFAAPSGSPSASFGQHDANGFQRQPVQDMDAPVWSVTVNSGRRWPGTVASGANATMRDYLTRDKWWSSFSRSDEAIRTANPGAVSASIDIDGRDFQNLSAQSVFLAKYFSLYGVRREFYSFSIPLMPESLAVELHDTIELKLPRFGLGAGKLFRVITQQIDCDKRTITYGVWG